MVTLALAGLTPMRSLSLAARLKEIPFLAWDTNTLSKSILIGSSSSLRLSIVKRFLSWHIFCLKLIGVPVLSCKAKSRTDKIMKKLSVSSKSPSDVIFIGTERDVTPGLNVS